jgi:hypothetical protein
MPYQKNLFPKRIRHHRSTLSRAVTNKVIDMYTPYDTLQLSCPLVVKELSILLTQFPFYLYSSPRVGIWKKWQVLGFLVYTFWFLSSL